MKPSGKFSPSVATIIGLLITSLLFAYLYLKPVPEKAKPIQTRAATLLPELRPLSPFSLLDQRGETYDNSRLRGHWTLLSFGYTHCPDICPTTLAEMAHLKQSLDQLGMQAPYEIGFVSVDPERDTPDRLAEYVTYFDPDFLGVTGSPEALTDLTRPLGIMYRKVITEGSAMNYVMDHSASLILIDPQGRYRALFSPPHDPAIMAEDILALSRAE
jgi:protein SCO1/2